jgi:hypothetical protein
MTLPSGKQQITSLVEDEYDNSGAAHDEKIKESRIKRE